MARTVILGGGFGGVAAATHLRRLLGPEHEVVIVDRGDTFMMGLRKLWALVGIAPMEEGQRRLSALSRHGIEVVQAEVDSIDPAKRAARTSRGELTADYLVVALGAETRPELVAGLQHHAHDIWRASGVPAAAAALQELRAGRIVILIAGAPYPCPPAPYECAMLVHEYLQTRGRRGEVQLTVATVQPLLLPNAGREGSDWLARQLAERGIAYQTGKRLQGVEGGAVRFEDGSLPFDLLIAVPPHRPPAVVRDSGLTGDADWISVDPGTLATSFERVYAVGDCTQIRLANGLPLPKAGIIAELEGTRVAEAIAAEVLRGGIAPPFDGRGYCFMEMGRHEATLIEGDFYAQPEPRVAFVDVSAEHAAAKRRFESERLAAWFGD